MNEKTRLLHTTYSITHILNSVSFLFTLIAICYLSDIFRQYADVQLHIVVPIQSNRNEDIDRRHATHTYSLAQSFLYLFFSCVFDVTLQRFFFNSFFCFGFISPSFHLKSITTTKKSRKEMYEQNPWLFLFNDN